MTIEHATGELSKFHASARVPAIARSAIQIAVVPTVGLREDGEVHELIRKFRLRLTDGQRDEVLDAFEVAPSA